MPTITIYVQKENYKLKSGESYSDLVNKVLKDYWAKEHFDIEEWKRRVMRRVEDEEAHGLVEMLDIAAAELDR